MKNAKRMPADPDRYDLLRLDNQLCFALYAATRAITRTYRDRLEPLGLTYTQFIVLVVLWETDGVTIKTIGEKLMLDSGTLTPLLKRLEAVKLLTRRRGAHDEREVYVSLTNEAWDLRDEVLDARKHVGCRLQMTEREILTLRADLMALIGKLGTECVSEAAESTNKMPA